MMMARACLRTPEWEVRDIGQIRFSLAKRTNNLLIDVRYVSGLRRNLISVRTLKASSHSIKL